MKEEYDLRRGNAFDHPTERTNEQVFKCLFPKLSKRMGSIRHISTIWSNDFRIQKETGTISETSKKSIFDVHDLYGVKLLTRLRVEFSDLRSHKYNHNFHCREPYCSCQTGIEDIENFLAALHALSTQRKTLLDLVSNLVGSDVMLLSSKELCTLLLYGNNDSIFLVSRGVIEETIKNIRNTKRFKLISAWL